MSSNVLENVDIHPYEYTGDIRTDQYAWNPLEFEYVVPGFESDLDLQTLEELSQQLISHYPAGSDDKESYYAPDGEYSSLGSLYESLYGLPPPETEYLDSGFQPPDQFFAEEWERRFGVLPIRRNTEQPFLVHASILETEPTLLSNLGEVVYDEVGETFSTVIGRATVQQYCTLVVVASQVNPAGTANLLRPLKQRAIAMNTEIPRGISDIRSKKGRQRCHLPPLLLSRGKPGFQESIRGLQSGDLRDRATPPDPWDPETWPWAECVIHRLIHDLLNLADGG